MKVKTCEFVFINRLIGMTLMDAVGDREHYQLMLHNILQHTVDRNAGKSKVKLQF